MFKINFTLEISKSYVGGNVFVNQEDLSIKLDNGLIPFLVLDNDFFPSQPLLSDEILVVFICKELFFGNSKRQNLRFITINDSSQSNHKEKFNVIKLRKGEYPLFDKNTELLPVVYINKSEFNDQESAEDLEDDNLGAQFSKFLGRPGYLQDEIYLGPKFDFELQIFEDELSEIEPFYDGVLNDGALYVYSTKNIKKVKNGQTVGTIFSQFV